MSNINPTLAHYYCGEDPANYLISEKFDGFRAIWKDGELWTKTGNPMNAPTWFTASLPPVALDGELWAGRGNYGKVMSAVKRGSLSPHWENLRLMVFDSDEHPELKTPERIAFTESLNLGEFAEAVEHFREPSRDGLANRLGAIQSAGGEGLCLRGINSNYEGGRDIALMKLKKLDQFALLENNLTKWGAQLADAFG